MSEQLKIPVILDTDIGGDIDDHWAVAQLLKCPQLETKLILTCAGNTKYRTKTLARFLEKSATTEVPIGIGIECKWHYNQTVFDPVIQDYDLAQYPGKLYADGVEQLVKTIMESPEPVTVIGIGPFPNLAEALELEPRIVNNSRLVLICGRIYEPNRQGNMAECNLTMFTAASQKIFSSDWDITIAPVESSGQVMLDGALYQRVKNCKDPAMVALIADYRHWDKHSPYGNKTKHEIASSTLFDTVAVYLAYAEDYLEIENMGLTVPDSGMFELTETGKQVRVAMRWKDLAAFKNELVDSLTIGV